MGLPPGTVWLDLAAGNNITAPYGAVEITAVDNDSLVYSVQRPSADSLNHALVAFVAGHRMTASTKARGFVGIPPFKASYDSGDGDPSVGDEVGTKEDSFLLSANSTGFTVCGVNTSDDIVWVRPPA